MRSSLLASIAGLLLAIACGNPPTPGPARPGPAASIPAPGASPPLVTGPSAREPLESTPGFNLAILPPPPLFAGSKYALWAGTPGKGLRWESSNPSVAAVDSTGLVHALSPGTASITAALALPDGSEQTASTAVTVRINPQGEAAHAHRGHRR